MNANQEKQINEVMELLSDYIATPPWEEGMVEVYSDAVAYVGEMLELTEDEVLDYLEEEPQNQMAHAHVFEHFATTVPNDDGETAVQAFMRTRVEQDGSYACRYLEALQRSELAIWEVLQSGGKQAQVRRLGSNGSAITVTLDTVERIPSEICVAARLLDVDGVKLFGFGMLPIFRLDADEILAYLAQVEEETRRTAQQEADADPQAVELVVQEEMADLLFHETLAAWVAQGFED